MKIKENGWIFILKLDN